MKLILQEKSLIAYNLQVGKKEATTVEDLENTRFDEIEQASENNSNELRKRKHKKYTVSINQVALKEIEGTATSSFIELARAVILIDGVPYDENKLTMSKARKIDLERLISHFAQLEIYGARKYYVKSVFNRVRKDIPNDAVLKINKKPPYTKQKPLTEAQKQARKIIYEAKKEKAKQEETKAASIVIRKAKEAAKKLNET